MKRHDMVSKFHHERESIFLSCPALRPLENPIDQTGLVSLLLYYYEQDG